MNQNWIGDISMGEIIWTVIGGMALLFTLIGVRQAYGDLRYTQPVEHPLTWGWLIRHVVNPYRTTTTARELIALGQLRRETINTILQVAFVGVGISAMLTPPAVRPAMQNQATIVAGLFIFAELLLAWGSLQDRIERRQLLRQYRQERAAARKKETGP